MSIARMGRFDGRTMALLALAAGIVSVAALGPSAIHAQPPTAARGGAFGTGNGPIDITADQLEVVDAENRAVWKGNVEALQGTNRMRSPQLTVFFAKSGNAPAAGAGGAPGAGWGAIQKMEAEGPVYYVTPQQNARGDHATYDASSNSILMTGNVVLVQDKNVVKGDRLTIDTTTNHSTLVSNAQGRTSSGRVRGVFYPSQNQTPGQGQAPASSPPAAAGEAKP